MIRVGIAVLCVGLLGCGTAVQDASPDGGEAPLSLELDRTSRLPQLTIRGSEAELQRLRSRYKSFAVLFGPPVGNIQLGVTQGYDGDLELPWTIPLDRFSSPYPVRVVGTTRDGKEEVIVEKIF